MKTRIENLKKEAREIQQMLLNDWMDEKNAGKANQLIADVNRMKYIESKCIEILKRGEKEETPIEKEAKKEK